MQIPHNNNLTRELAAIGIPNPYPEFGFSRQETAWLFGRSYSGWLRVIDMVTTPYGEDVYRRCAEGDIDTDLHFDATGHEAQRGLPSPRFTFAIVRSPSYSQFWSRLQQAASITADPEHGLILSDEFVATFGAPRGVTPLPE